MLVLLPYIISIVVASDMNICSDVGLSILRDLQGNAVDAAVATALCLGVVNPYVFTLSSL